MRTTPADSDPDEQRQSVSSCFLYILMLSQYTRDMESMRHIIGIMQACESMAPENQRTISTALFCLNSACCVTQPVENAFRMVADNRGIELKNALATVFASSVSF